MGSSMATTPPISLLKNTPGNWHWPVHGYIMITLKSRVECQTMFPALKAPNLQVCLLTYKFVPSRCGPGSIQRFPKTSNIKKTKQNKQTKINQNKQTKRYMTKSDIVLLKVYIDILVFDQLSTKTFRPIYNWMKCNFLFRFSLFCFSFVL